MFVMGNKMFDFSLDLGVLHKKTRLSGRVFRSTKVCFCMFVGYKLL